jgi:hypothetical protein
MWIPNELEVPNSLDLIQGITKCSRVDINNLTH